MTSRPHRVLPPVPDVLLRNALESWGDQGRQWLARLPEVLDDVVHEWDLEVGTPFPLSYHWVAPVTRADGSPAVLKLGVPDGHLAVEAKALRAYDGDAAVRLFAFDAERGAMLMERADPGTPLSTLVPDHDQDATVVLIDVGRRLHRRVPGTHALPDLREAGRSFGEHLDRFPGDDPLPRHLVEAAGRLFGDLCASARQRVLLHGDLHHDNVLLTRSGDWLAIDPHGVSSVMASRTLCLLT